jgi:hypothetical protein
MEYWLTKALECLPELEDQFTAPQSITGATSLWIEIWLKLVEAYDVTPVKEDLIRRIYGFAAWCLNQPSTTDIETDVGSAVAIGFIENIPLEKRVSEDLHRWMSMESLKGFEHLFRYHLSNEDYRRFVEDFRSRKRPSDPPPRL